MEFPFEGFLLLTTSSCEGEAVAVCLIVRLRALKFVIYFFNRECFSGCPSLCPAFLDTWMAVRVFRSSPIE
jgi:hypothetical protein